MVHILGWYSLIVVLICMIYIFRVAIRRPTYQDELGYHIANLIYLPILIFIIIKLFY